MLEEVLEEMLEEELEEELEEVLVGVLVGTLVEVSVVALDVGRDATGTIVTVERTTTGPEVEDVCVDIDDDDAEVEVEDGDGDWVDVEVETGLDDEALEMDVLDVDELDASTTEMETSEVVTVDAAAALVVLGVSVTVIEIDTVSGAEETSSVTVSKMVSAEGDAEAVIVAYTVVSAVLVVDDPPSTSTTE